MYRRLVFLFFKCNVKRAHSIPSTGTLFIAKNERIKQSAKKMGDAYSVDDLLTQNENYTLHTRARDIMKAWADSHYTDYSGVSLGDLFISFYDIFLPYLKQVYVLEKAVEKYRPSEVIAVGSDHTLFSVFKTVCERAGTGFKVLHQPFDEVGEIISDYFEMGGVSNIRSLFYHRRGDVSSGDKAKPIFSPLVFEFCNLLLGRMKNLVPVFLMERTLSLMVNILRPDYYSIKGKDGPHKSKVDVLSLCSFKNSVTTLSGLVNTLNGVGMTATCLVTHPDGLLECRAQKVPYIMVGEYYSDDLRKKIREDAKKVRASWWSNVHDEKFRALFTDDGVDLFDLVRPSLFLIYMVGFEYAVTLLNLFEEAFRDLDPEALLLSDDVGFAGRAFVRGAKNRVPSLNVQHGTFVDIIRYGELVSTKMAVWGEYSRKELVDYGVDPKKIVVTGMPRINMILEHVKNTEFDPVKAFKGKRILLWTPVCYTDLDSFDKINRRILNSLCKIFRENGLSSAYKIVVKIHPLDSKDLYLNLIKKMGEVDVTVLQNEYNVYDLINHCKLLLTTTSTTGLEAIVLDKPLAVINMWGLEETIPYVKSGAGLLIRNEDELTDLLVHLEDLDLEASLDEGRRRFKEIYLYKIDGLYNQRIVDAIKKL